ncbi:MAG TPA: rRNA adenine dimethyltransferase family protein, partial [Patescibacteria group bacterium]|nr:rRNA adenine dimethyltransferase family protein [Patescibacteria group bacterium]
AEIENQKTENVQIWNQNVLDLKLPPDSFSSGYKLVANLPYNISSVFLRKFLTSSARPDLMVLLLQKEVAERIVAKPPNMSLLALSVQYYAEPQFIKKVSPASFWPRPRVESAIVKLKIRSKFKCSPREEKKLFQVIRIGFSSKRKMLKNNLAGGLRRDAGEVEKIFLNLDFNPKVRPQELSLEDWLKIITYF